MVRPKVKDGQHLHLNIDKEVIELINTYRGDLSMSSFVELAVRAVVEGPRRIIAIQNEILRLKKEIKEIHAEKEMLEKENKRLKKKTMKLDEECKKLKLRCRGRNELIRMQKKANEMKALAGLISGYIEEGMSWREVMIRADIVDPRDQLDMFEKLFKNYGGYYLSEYLQTGFFSGVIVQRGYLAWCSETRKGVNLGFREGTKNENLQGTDPEMR